MWSSGLSWELELVFMPAASPLGYLSLFLAQDLSGSLFSASGSHYVAVVVLLSDNGTHCFASTKLSLFTSWWYWYVPWWWYQCLIGSNKSAWSKGAKGQILLRPTATCFIVYSPPFGPAANRRGKLSIRFNVMWSVCLYYYSRVNPLIPYFMMTDCGISVASGMQSTGQMPHSSARRVPNPTMYYLYWFS